MDKFDSQGMYKIYDMWPQIAKEAYELDFEPVDYKNIDHIVFSGMGGSEAIGDIFSAILSKTDIHVNVIKGNILSKLINLIYFLDYSTIYRAILSEIDSSPIKSIDYVKEKL